MEEKFQNRFRIPSARLKDWDYGSEGSYFITICSHSREYYFGKIILGMNLSPIGQLAVQYWLEIPLHFPDVELGNFVVMPNHVHGILIIQKSVNINNAKTYRGRVGALRGCVETLQCNVSTPTHPGKSSPIRPVHSSVDPDKREQMSKISPHAGSISTIVRSYKSVVTKHAHFINPEFEWQERFYDHIIRDAESFGRIQDYIEDNPRNWNKDTFYQRP